MSRRVPTQVRALLKEIEVLGNGPSGSVAVDDLKPIIRDGGAIDKAIEYAEKSGWLKTDGDPPLSVTITEEGRALTVRNSQRKKRRLPF